MQEGDFQTGRRCPTCDAFMSRDARSFHSCVAFRRLRERRGFGGVASVAGVRYATRMDRQGCIRERERVAA